MKTYVFDVDGTLFPRNSKSSTMRMDDHIKKIQQVMNLSCYEEAHKKSTELYERYGSTFAGLNIVGNISFEEFYDFSEKWDYSEVYDEDKELEELIRGLNGKKYIYSAGNRQHLIKSIKALGICATMFDGIFGCDDGDIFLPKPHKKTQQLFIDMFNIDKSSIVYFEDSLKCINAAANDGWGICCVINNGEEEATQHPQFNCIKECLRTIT